MNRYVLMGYFKIWLPLWAAYLGFTANLEWLNLLFGAALAVGILLLIRPRVAALTPRQLVFSIATLLVYVLIIAWEVLKNGFVVARIVLTPSLPIKPGVIGIASGTDSRMAQALSAHSITITPGEFVLEMDQQGTLYIHSLDMDRTEPIAEQEQARRIRWLERIVSMDHAQSPESPHTAGRH